MTTLNYTAVIRLEGELWFAECPEAGSVGQGETPEEALAKLKEASGVEWFHLQSFATETDLHRARRRQKEKPLIGTPEGELYRSEEPWCDSELLGILQSCSELRTTTKWGDWRKNYPETTIWLQAMDLEGSYLQGIQLQDAHLENSKLSRSCFDGGSFLAAHLEGCFGMGSSFARSVLTGAYIEKAFFMHSHFDRAKLIGVRLEGAVFFNVHFEGVQLFEASLENSSFEIIVDGATYIKNCSIDTKTNFTMTGLDSARIEPRLLAALKTNIRRIEWQRWYDECKAKRAVKQKPSRPGLFSKIMPPLLDNGLILLVLPLLLLFAWPVWGVCRIVAAVWRNLTQYGVTASFMRLFWWISDYGSSTRRVLGTFLATVLIFTCLYSILEGSGIDILDKIAVPKELSFVPLADWLVKLFFFSFATMLTLGFGNINVALESAHPWLGMSIVAVNLFSGYFLLAVLVTRIGILFQSLGPEQEVERAKGTSSGKEGKS